MAESKMKSLVGKPMLSKVNFMGEKIEIRKLTVAEVQAIQDEAKAIEKDADQGFNVLKSVIRKSCADAAELTDEDFQNFPLDELSKLSNEIMQFSGIGTNQGK